MKNPRLCRIILARRNSEQCFLGTLASSDRISQMKHLTLKKSNLCPWKSA